MAPSFNKPEFSLKNEKSLCPASYWAEISFLCNKDSLSCYPSHKVGLTFKPVFQSLMPSCHLTPTLTFRSALLPHNCVVELHSNLPEIYLWAVHAVSVWAWMFGFNFILCIYIQVNHVKPELSGVFLRVQEGRTRVVKANLSCHQLLNGERSLSYVMVYM